MTGFSAHRPSPRHATNGRAPLIMALEPRLMFDGAAMVEAVHQVDAADPTPPAATKEVAFVDQTVTGWQDLAAGLRDGVEVVYIEAGQSGLDVMAQWAQSHSGYDAIHVLSHGADGTVRLGADTVNTAALDDSAVVANLTALGNALNADGDLLLYGCRVAVDQNGQDLLARLAQITGADVAASDDLTGAAALGGDWVLEHSAGSIEAASVAGAAMAGFNGVLADQTFDLDSGVTFDAGAKTASQTAGGFTLRATGTASSITDVAGAGTGSTVTNSGEGLYFGIDAEESLVTYTLTGGQTFNLSSFYIIHESGGGNKTFTLTTGSTSVDITVPDTGSSVALINVAGLAEAASFQNITSFTIGPKTGTAYFYMDEIALTNISEPNAAPAIGGASAGQTVNDNSTVSPFSAVTITDAESNNVTVTVTLDTQAKGAFTAASLTASGFTDNGNGSYSLAATTPANAQAAIRQLVFDPADNRVAVGSTETTTFTIAVNDGTTTTNDTTTTVVSTSMNDAPTVGTNTGATLDEGATATIGTAALSISDVDPSSTLTLTVGTAPANGTLWLDTNGNSTLDGGETLSASGTFTQADIAANRLKYTHNGGETTTDSFVFTVSDGSGGTIGNTTFTITVTPVNDAPAFSNLNGTPTFTEGGTAVQLDADVSVTDSELTGSNYNGATLTIARNGGANAQDVFAGAGNLSALTESGNLVLSGVTIGTVTTNSAGTLVLTFNTNATQARVTETLQSLTYSNSSDTPPASVQLDWTFSDGNSGNAQGSGGAKTGTGSTTVSITATNDAPAFTGLNGAPTVNEQTAVTLDSDVTVADPELAGGNYNGAGLTIARNGGANADDSFGFDTSGALFTVSGGNLQSGGQTFATFTNTGGTLSISFTGSGTAATSALVNNVLQRIQYTNTSDNPDTSVQLNWSFSDGNSGAQGTGGALAATGSTTVTVTPVNDVPVLANLNGDSVNFSVGGNAVTLDDGGNATVTDPDSAHFNGGNVTVSITANGVAGEDVLGIANQGTGAGQIGVSGSNVTYGGTTIGTIAGGSNGADLVVSLNANASPAAVQALVRALTYTDTDASTVNTTARTIRVTVNDGAGTSANHDVTVSLVAAPIIDLDGNDSSGATNGGYNASFTENGGAVAIADSDATLTDDGANLNQLVITLTNAQTGDVLTLSGRTTGDVVNGITITYTSSSVITLSGTGTKADYLALLKEARFNNSSEAPNTTTRTITVAARDTDNNTGSAVSASVTVTALNDAPALSGNLALPAVNEDTAAPAGATIATLADGLYSDPDNGAETINGLAVIGNTANASTEGAWQYSTDGGTTWHAVGTVADGATALALSSATRLRFVPVADYNGTPPALSVRALDASYSAGWTSGATRVTVDTTSTGGTTAIAATARDVTTSITSVNDSPVVTLTSGATTYSAGVAVDATLTLADVDSANLTRAVITITNLGDGASESLALSTAAQTAATNYGLTVGVYDAGTGTLTITGTATKAQYQEVLRGMTYTNSADPKTGTSRTISFVVRDSSGDGGTQDSATANKTVNYNTAPVASGTTLSTTGTSGSALSYALPAGTFTDPGDTLTYTASGLPAGLTIDAATGALSGTPTTAGTYTITVTATDTSGATATKTVSVTIGAAAASPAPPAVVQPPAADPAPLPGIGEGNTIVVPVVTVVREPTVTDKPADMQTVVRSTSLGGTAGGTDSGGGLGGGLGGGTGSTTGGLGGGLGSLGGGLTAGTGNSFQISVAPRPAGGGDALVVNAPMRDAVISEGSRISVTVPATAFAHTSSGASVTLSATRSNGASLPGWMNFNPRTGTFEGTPPPGFRGEVVVRVIARDNQGREAVQTFKIVVGQGGGAAAPQGGGDGPGQDQGQGQGQPGGAPGQTGEAPHPNDGKLAQLKPMGRPSLTEQLREQSQQAQQAKLAALFGVKQSNVA